VNLQLTPEQEMFREATRKFIATETPLTTVRTLYGSRAGYNADWWRRAAELGWSAPFAPGEFGGGTLAGRAAADAVIVAEEMGRLVAPGPFLPVTVVIAALVAEGSSEQRDALLPPLVAGRSVAAWAFGEPGGRWAPHDHGCTAIGDGRDVVINGTKAYVEAGADADTFLVTAMTGAGLSQVLVASDTSGVTVTPGRSVDMTRRFARMHFDSVRVPRSCLVGPLGGAGPAVARQYHLAIALQCAELVGIADRVLELTLAYGSERLAFGRPVVSFQALKHRIADMTVWLESSKAVSDALAAAVDDGRPDAALLSHVAKAYVAEHCPDIVDDCVQISGGIGVTWEHDIHLYNRRAAVDRAVFGTPEEHKQQVFAALTGEKMA
jgi:alkylation response protein AidB-like acyl-CoA dehydrogenase